MVRMITTVADTSRRADSNDVIIKYVFKDIATVCQQILSR